MNNNIFSLIINLFEEFDFLCTVFSFMEVGNVNAQETINGVHNAAIDTFYTNAI